MTKYCGCGKCKTSPAKSKQKSNNTSEIIKAEAVRGVTGTLTLVHYSAASFESLQSTEIANINGKDTVCISFFLYDNDGAVPDTEKMLKLMGLGGNQQYRINVDVDSHLGVVYYKKTNGSPAEIVLPIGCGGKVTYGAAVGNVRTATGITWGADVGCR